MLRTESVSLFLSDTFGVFVGTRDGDGNLVPTFIMEWRRGSDAFKKSIKKMQKINCANPAVVDNNPLDPVTGRKVMSGKKDRPHDSNGGSTENDDDSMEAKTQQPKIQFDLSENFRREMELHNIAAQQEKAREEELARKEKRRKDRRRKLERKKPETARNDEESEGEPFSFHGSRENFRRFVGRPDPRRKEMNNSLPLFSLSLTHSLASQLFQLK